jgi:hypothetical protein
MLHSQRSRFRWVQRHGCQSLDSIVTAEACYRGVWRSYEHVGPKNEQTPSNYKTPLLGARRQLGFLRRRHRPIRFPFWSRSNQNVSRIGHCARSLCSEIADCSPVMILPHPRARRCSLSVNMPSPFRSTSSVSQNKCLMSSLNDTFLATDRIAPRLPSFIAHSLNSSATKSICSSLQIPKGTH